MSTDKEFMKAAPTYRAIIAGYWNWWNRFCHTPKPWAFMLFLSPLAAFVNSGALVTVLFGLVYPPMCIYNIYRFWGEGMT